MEGQPKVVVYSTPTCVYCKMAKEFFDQNNVEYADLNVAEDEAARNEMVEKSGQMGVPVIMIDDEITVGFDQERIKGLLKL